MKKKKNLLVISVIVVILLGVGTGYGIASMGKSTTTTLVTSDTSGDQTGESKTETTSVKVGQVFGSKDTSAFKDSAEGVVVAGGIGGEGSHHIVRPGGDSQNVYLTSSVMDLKMFEGHKVKVYGETFKAQKAGWLMDVGRAEVLQLNAPVPDSAKKTTNELVPEE